MFSGSFHIEEGSAWARGLSQLILVAGNHAFPLALFAYNSLSLFSAIFPSWNKTKHSFITLPREPECNFGWHNLLLSCVLFHFFRHLVLHTNQRLWFKTY